MNSNQIEAMFELTYEQIIDDIHQDQCHMTVELEQAKQWLERAIKYNLANGKRNRANALVLTYQKLNSESLSVEKMEQACLLGWCVELMQAYFLMADDIMDESITRRGQLCWYRKENVGMTAINDSIMVNNCLFFVLNKHFGEMDVYVKLVDLFNQVRNIEQNHARVLLYFLVLLDHSFHSLWSMS